MKQAILDLLDLANDKVYIVSKGYRYESSSVDRVFTSYGLAQLYVKMKKEQDKYLDYDITEMELTNEF